MNEVDINETKVLVLGGSGMLGSMVADVLRKNKNIELYATARNSKVLKQRIGNLEWVYLDINNQDVEELSVDIEELVKDKHYVINCIGMTKPFTHDDNRDEITRAIRNNSTFPHILEEVATEHNVKVIQIATDCVYSGLAGDYSEKSKSDALDVYGKTKSLGEVISDNVWNLRCSIIGPEPKTPTSYLMEWFLTQPGESECDGYANHFWNGITTLHFAKICEGIVLNDVSTMQNMQHIVPSSKMAKHDMLEAFGNLFGRKDIKINKVDAPVVVDRTLSTISEVNNLYLWKNAGYDTPPTVKQMLEELSEYDYGMEIKI